MAKIAVSLKIDVTKIDKAKLFKGDKGTYLDATVFIDIDQADQYGNNGMITQSITKEEKESGVKGNILGNCKVYWRDAAAPAQSQQMKPVNQAQAKPAPAQQAGNNEFDDDVPF